MAEGLLIRKREDKSVVQLSLSGKHIKTFESTWQIRKQTNIRCRYALDNNTYYAKGYFWIYKKDYVNKNYDLKNNKHFLE